MDEDTKSKYPPICAAATLEREDQRKLIPMFLEGDTNHSELERAIDPLHHS